MELGQQRHTQISQRGNKVHQLLVGFGRSSLRFTEIAGGDAKTGAWQFYRRFSDAEIWSWFEVGRGQLTDAGVSGSSGSSGVSSGHRVTHPALVDSQETFCMALHGSC